MRFSNALLSLTLLVFALPGLTGCPSGTKVRKRTQAAEEIAAAARKSNAYRCAPKELAYAEFHVKAAFNELDEGNSGPAEKHAIDAEKWAREAATLSKDCATKTIIIKPKKKLVIAIVDRDNDGVIDPEDNCPDVPGPVEHKGCPDSDGDGLFDDVDRCIMDPEDKDNFQDEDGCPDPDNDADTILDIADKCPMEPGPAGTQGCPDQDNDGIVDGEDKCPLEPGPRDSNAGIGCPPQYKLVVKTKDKIEIRQKIQFATGKATILGKSFELLREVGQVFKDSPEIKKVRIEGHTDSVGNDKFNQKLSDNRAKSVRDFLIKEGVDAARLEAIGHGESKPIESNATAKGREGNRRVEFFIVDQ